MYVYVCIYIYSIVYSYVDMWCWYVQDDQRPVDDLDAERIKYEAQYDAELDVDMQQVY